MSKRIAALLLTLAMLLALAGCGGETASAAAEAEESASAAVSAEAPAAEAPEAPAEEAPAEAAPAETPAEAPAEEPETPQVSELVASVFGEAAPAEAISYPIETEESLEMIVTCADHLLAAYENATEDFLIFQTAEEKTGVNLDITSLSTMASSEQFTVLVASGGYPDLVGWGLNYVGGDELAVEEEVYLDLVEYIPQYAPNYYNILTSDDELLDKAVTDAGYIVGFHVVRPEGALGKEGLVIRTDLLEKHGMDKPYTIEEWENTLAMFKDEGLDQPLVMLSTSVINGNFIASAFDVNAYLSNFPFSSIPVYVEDGTVKFGPVEDGFKEYITLIKEWYDKGYIHPDYVTVNQNWNSAEYSNVITTGEAGIFFTDQGNIGGYLEVSEVEGFALEGTYDMHATEDSVNHFGSFTKKSVQDGFKITSNCENVELACRWGDWWYSEEGSLLANWGVEGTSFNYDADGNPVFTEIVTNNDTWAMRDALMVYASNSTISCILDPTAVTSGYSDVDKAAPEIWAAGMDDSYVIPSEVALNTDESSEATAMYSDIETHCLEHIAKFINGDKPLEEFDAFVQTIYDLGIEDFLAIYQGAYDRCMNG